MTLLENRELFCEPWERHIGKITGTRVPQILGRSQYHSAFEAATYIIGARHGHYVGDRNVDGGRKLEPWQIELAQRRLAKAGIEVQSWSQAYGPDVYDAWPEDPLWGGKWDALGYRDGRPFVLIECKTTKYTPQLYEDHRVQAMYYGYMTGARWAMILETRTPSTGEPGASVFSGDTSVIWWIDMEKARPEIEFLMGQVKAWYEYYILNGLTPPYDPENPHDMKVLQDLVKWGKLPTEVLRNL